MQLRPYQETALQGIRGAYLEGKRAPLLCAPTGSGKSKMTQYMLGRTNKQTLYLCHRAELMEMIHDDLAAARIPHDVIGGGRTPDAKIQVGMMQTVARRLDVLPEYQWVISDEAHLAMAPTWTGILKHYGRAHHLGMSATPCRLDGKGLGDIYDSIVYGPQVRDLMELGYLTRCRAFSLPSDLSALKKSGADYQMEQAAAMLDTSRITGDAVHEYQKHAAGQRAIVFCCTVEHARHVADQFRAAGIPATSIDGGMPKADRQARVSDFQAGRTLVLTNVDLLTTGFDCPPIVAAIFLRPTQSLALYLQMVGRILRIASGKLSAIILDHVGNVLRHGLPDDIREWSLDGRPVKGAATQVRQCPECFAAFRPASRCPECGHSFAVEAPRQAKKLVAGDLTEIGGTRPMTREEWLATGPYKDVLKSIRTLADLQAMQKARGYDWRWTRRMAEMKRLVKKIPERAA